MATFNTRRRLVAAAALAVGAGVLWPALRGRWAAREFDFVALDEPAGFRSLHLGAVSVGLDPLAGLQGGGAAAWRGRDGLCRALFGSNAPAAGVVPVAVFTDYRCPYCRVLSELLGEIEGEAGGAVTVVRHEWPILGEASEQAARAALAARRQGAYGAFHARLMRSAFLPTPAYLADLARRVGVDADRLVGDMHAPEVERELGDARALAALFRFPGTPGLVVGRTVVIGAIGEARLRALIARERADGPVPACAG